jgi:hypothetical protein
MRRVICIAASLTVSVTTLAGGSNAVACPLWKLAQELERSVKGLRIREIPVSGRQSLEGSVWKVVLLASGRLHSIQRFDYGETGQRQTYLVRMDRWNLAIRVVQWRYKEPIRADKRTEISERSSKDYFVCGDLIYAPLRADDSRNTTELVNEVSGLKRLFFDAKELAQYLRP